MWKIEQGVASRNVEESVDNRIYDVECHRQLSPHDWPNGASGSEKCKLAPESSSYVPSLTLIVLHVPACIINPFIHNISQYTLDLPSQPVNSSIMFRATVARAMRVAARPQTTSLNFARPQVATSLLQSRSVPSFVIPSIRFYSAPAGLSREEVQGRIMDLLKNFDKVRQGQRAVATFIANIGYRFRMHQRFAVTRYPRSLLF